MRLAICNLLKHLQNICQEQEIDDELEFLILASDGLWDVVTNDVSAYLLKILLDMVLVPCSFNGLTQIFNFQEAVAMVKPIEDPEQAAKGLLQEASQRGSADNITVVIVRFLDGTTTSAGDGPSEEVAKDQST